MFPKVGTDGNCDGFEPCDRPSDIRKCSLSGYSPIAPVVRALPKYNRHTIDNTGSECSVTPATLHHSHEPERSSRCSDKEIMTTIYDKINEW